MPDIISALAQKKANIIKQQRDLENKYEAEKMHLGHELQLINQALKTINDAVERYLCPSCGGTGTIRVCDAAGDMDDETCPACQGTGVKMNDENIL